MMEEIPTYRKRIIVDVFETMYEIKDYFYFDFEKYEYRSNIYSLMQIFKIGKMAAEISFLNCKFRGFYDGCTLSIDTLKEIGKI
jgi:hypothetical protein